MGAVLVDSLVRVPNLTCLQRDLVGLSVAVVEFTANRHCGAGEIVLGCGDGHTHIEAVEVHGGGENGTAIELQLDAKLDEECVDQLAEL